MCCFLCCRVDITVSVDCTQTYLEVAVELWWQLCYLVQQQGGRHRVWAQLQDVECVCGVWQSVSFTSFFVARLECYVSLVKTFRYVCLRLSHILKRSVTDPKMMVKPQRNGYTSNPVAGQMNHIEHSRYLMILEMFISWPQSQTLHQKNIDVHCVIVSTVFRTNQMVLLDLCITLGNFEPIKRCLFVGRIIIFRSSKPIVNGRTIDYLVFRRKLWFTPFHYTLVNVDHCTWCKL